MSDKGDKSIETIDNEIAELEGQHAEYSEQRMKLVRSLDLKNTKSKDVTRAAELGVLADATLMRLNSLKGMRVDMLKKQALDGILAAYDDLTAARVENEKARNEAVKIGEQARKMAEDARVAVSESALAVDTLERDVTGAIVGAVLAGQLTLKSEDDIRAFCQDHELSGSFVNNIWRQLTNERKRLSA